MQTYDRNLSKKSHISITILESIAGKVFLIGRQRSEFLRIKNWSEIALQA